MFTMPYDATRRALLHPGDTDDFFQHGPIPSEAALCAEMSRLAYVKEIARLDTYLARGGFSRVAAIGYETRGTQVFVARSSLQSSRSLAVVAFRGTEPDDPTDLFTDARFDKKKWGDTGSVHAGFLAALPEQAALEQAIPPDVERLLFTGHSLGAALATLAGSLHPPHHLYTFGSPRPGDADFARRLHGIEHARYVDCCDLVPQVPPEFLGYAHSGVLHYINRNGDILVTPSAEAMEQDQREATRAYLFRYAFLSGTVAVRALADHAPINYVSAAMGLRA